MQEQAGTRGDASDPASSEVAALVASKPNLSIPGNVGWAVLHASLPPGRLVFGLGELCEQNFSLAKSAKEQGKPLFCRSLFSLRFLCALCVLGERNASARF